MICGPRCVQFILQHYGIQADLIELVKEIQWPDFEAGASLAAIQDALQKRGIHACAMRIDPQSRLRWNDPVLLHLKGDTEVGHYVIRLPSGKPDRETLWVGLGCKEEVLPEKLSVEMSGVILLTSAEPITEPEAAVVENFSFSRRLLLILGAVLVIGALWLYQHSNSKSARRNLVRSC